MRNGYTHAQKIQAAFTYGFNCIAGLGLATWERSEVTGKMKGNPSVSSLISSYMVQAGETATSSHAVTPEIIGHMYDYKRQPEHWNIRSYEPSKRKKDKESEEWGGPRFRREVHLAFTLAFACLLRVDEVLKIQAREIEIVLGQKKCIKVTLPFQKTNQFGHVQPFYLYALPNSLKHLCPVRAYADWINLTHINEGYIFCKLGSGDRVSANPNAQLTSEAFLEGCQWLSCDLRWPLRKICEWGGWSTDFSHLTIVKYLISWNNDPRNKREDFFNMDREPQSKCFACGRSCECA
ncbi:DNA breaking-rejoining enzyme [Rhodocollybia butyracea]|uniref:DNA breaking-rejoining enzyme n=1 Tax=Rhodocollybia butyracea TaxID=206335 RepID=A0A9P5PXY2_9AGAR|nr:DNA breaking-rejoining enzyme [Rhodocollybia butyracea]